MVKSASIQWFVVWLFLASLRGILLKPLPQGTVTQSGEPSHFQVDDKAAEIEVNANPAGVKVNAKPASLQVVAKPGTPAIPVYHPAIHVAPHYLPPPVIHREPAMFYSYHHHHHCHPCCSPLCFGRSRGWFYAGLKRNDLPKPTKTKHKQNRRKSFIPTPSDRGTLGRELDETGNVIDRSHKSSIPRPDKEQKDEQKSQKRQFIAPGFPQSYQPQGISSIRLQPINSILGTRPPIARSILPYGGNTMRPFYNQPFSNNGLGTLNHLVQTTPNYLGMYGGYGPIQSQIRSFSTGTPNYALGPSSGPPKGNFLNRFIQSEINHELYGSSVAASPLRDEHGYSRSLLASPLVQQPNGYGSLLSGTMGNPFGGPYRANVLGAYGNSGNQGIVSGYGNSAMTTMARLFASQPLSSVIPGMQQYSQARSVMPPLLQQFSQSRSVLPFLQQYSQSRSTLPQFSYPYITGNNAMAARSKVPGSKLLSKKKNENKNAQEKIASNNVTTSQSPDDLNSKLITSKKIVGAEGKNDTNSKQKRQLLDSGLDLDVLQDALVNEFKREMILGNPQAQEPPPIAALASPQPSLGFPLPGIQPAAGQTGQSGNLMDLEDLGANYVAPVERYNAGNPLMRSQAMASIALGRSRVSPDQLTLMPQQVQSITSPRLPLAPQASIIRQQPQIQQRFIQNKPPGFIQNGNEYVGLPMRLNEDYRSPIEFDDQRPRPFRRSRHPIFRRRLHHHYYDDDEDGYDDYYHDEQPEYHERLGREKITIGGPYSENEVPSNEGETLLDTNHHGFGPITVEAKTAEGLKKSISPEDKRGAIVKPKRLENAPFDSDSKKSGDNFRYGVL